MLGDVRVYVQWTAASGKPQGSSLGHIAVPRQHRNHAHSFAVDRLLWMIDFERVLGSMAEDRRRLLTLLAMGHSQSCAAAEMGLSLRSCGRLARDSYDELRAGAGQRGAVRQIKRSAVLAPVACICEKPGRKPKAAATRKERG